MSTEEYIHWLQIGYRILLFGGAGFISLLVIYTILRTLKEDYRTRGFLGLLIGLIKLAIFVGIIGIIVFLAIANDWLGAIDRFIAGL
ncbi:MAG: hypothetical protein N3A72_06660 [bacterium]|nr:hypothetical protein [bacterium]